MRASESLSKTMARREQDRAYTAKKRLLETSDETVARLEQVRAYTAKRRAFTISIYNAIAIKGKDGSRFCMHQLSPYDVQTKCCSM